MPRIPFSIPSRGEVCEGWALFIFAPIAAASGFQMDSFVCSKCGLVPDRTQHGRLPPWEVAKAIAYSTVITDISEHLGQAANELIGERVDDYIAKKLKLVGGGSPTARAVRHVVARNRNGDFYPGKPCENP